MKRFLTRWMTFLVVALSGTVPIYAQEFDPVFDVERLLENPIKAETIKRTIEDGIVIEDVRFAFTFDGDKTMDVFGHFAYPEGQTDLPAFLWVSGGFNASIYFAKLGARRGYAALEIDFPTGATRTKGDFSAQDFSAFGDDINPSDSPVYYGAVAMLQAVSFLQSRPEVDPQRIGVAGNSLGGFFATLLAGLDTRVKAGASMFGAGFFHLGNLYWDLAGRQEDRDETYRQQWAQTLDPAARLDDTKAAMAWFTGVNDEFFWLPSVVETYKTAGGPKLLALLPNYNQGLTPELDEQVFVWLDVHLQGAQALNEVGTLEVQRQGEKLVARWPFQAHRPVRRAELMLSFGEPGNWPGRYWLTRDAEITGDEVQVELPAMKLPYAVIGTVIDRDGFRSSTPMVQVDPTAQGLEPKRSLLEYDGCAMWGGFEKPHVEYLQALAQMNPKVIEDAYQGTQAAMLPAGQHQLGRAQFTAGVPHELTAYFKADQSTKIVVEINGIFDYEWVQERGEVDVGAEWTKVTLNYLPPNVPITRLLYIHVTVPDGKEVAIDSVSLRPVPTVSERGEDAH